MKKTARKKLIKILRVFVTITGIKYLVMFIIWLGVARIFYITTICLLLAILSQVKKLPVPAGGIETTDFNDKGHIPDTTLCGIDYYTKK